MLSELGCASSDGSECPVYFIHIHVAFQNYCLSLEVP